MTGYVRQALANIQPNLNINAEDFNAEFNALQTAFDSVSGHTHDGTVGSGGRVGRILLTNDTTFYVSTIGNNNNTGLTVGSPWLTIQHAWDTLAMTYDLAGHQATIQLAAGTYTGGLIAAGTLTGQINSITDATSGDTTLGSGILIQGDTTTPSNVFVQVAGAHGFQINFGAIVRLAGMKVSSTGSGGGFGVTQASFGYVGLSNMEYGVCDTAQIHVGAGKAVEHNAAIVSGAAPVHYLIAHSGSQLFNNTTSYTITGTPAFSTAFINCLDLGYYLSSAAFTGSATGVRYLVSGNAVVNTTGGGASYFPGGSAGSTATGGQYI